MSRSKSSSKSVEVSTDELDPTQLVNELVKIVDDAVKCARMESEIRSLLSKRYKIYEYSSNDYISYTINVGDTKFKRAELEPHIHCKDTNSTIIYITVSIYGNESKICFQPKGGSEICYKLNNIDVRDILELYCNLSGLKEEIRKYLNNKLANLPKTLEFLKKVVAELDILTK